MIIKHSDVKVYGGHILDMSRTLNDISPNDEYIIQESNVSKNKFPYELKNSLIDYSVNIQLDAVNRNGDVIVLIIPLFKFNGVSGSVWVEDDIERFVEINNEYFTITYQTMTSSLRRDTFDMSSLLRVNKYIFGIHWREWIESSKHKLYVDL